MAEKGEFGGEDKSMHFMILSKPLLRSFTYLETKLENGWIYSYESQVDMCVT